MAQAPRQLPGLGEVVQSGRDLWGEAAMQQRNGASYEFFRDLLPPPRYVHADYRYYPLILSAPKSHSKASLVSNGSGLNVRGGARSWKDNGIQVLFRVGPDEFLFGGLRDRVSEPSLVDGYLPIVRIEYQHPSPVQSEGAVPLKQTKAARPPEVYQLEAFASTDPNLSANGVVFVQFSLTQGQAGTVTLDFDETDELTFDKLKSGSGSLADAQGGLIAVFGKNWTWERNRALCKIKSGDVAQAAIATKPMDDTARGLLANVEYLQQRDLCKKTWNDVLEQGMSVELPEPLLNHAWRNLIIQNSALTRGNRMHYSALNQYDALYESEGSDAALAALVWGHHQEVRQLLEPLLDFQRKGLEYHNAGTKILNVCRYYWQTRDAESVRALRPRWEKEAALLIENRTATNGLFPKERYCGDISTQVYSLNANAKAWRALRDLSAVLADINELDEAKRLGAIAAEHRRIVLAAVEKSVDRTIDPPFVPIALLDEEPSHNPITHVRIGSYWNIIVGYTIASGIFPPGSAEENWIPRYQENFGGICMGMIRSGGAAFNFWSGEHRVNPLYGTRYALDTLRRDDPERALVSLYGMLAQGMTRNTFVGGEGCTLEPVDDGGRFFYCPPNSAANAHVLSMLRYQLLQDWDLDDDGRPESLRLLFGTSRRWLEDGNRIRIDRAPTAFGPVSMLVNSHLKEGFVMAEVELPSRNRPESTQLRIRVPEGWKIDRATIGNKTLEVDSMGTVRLAEAPAKVSIKFWVSTLR
ncbi:MAG: hypothetical protein ABL921_15670 [Pirellula sp.]